MNPTLVEAVVMQRMERLRTYQLAHPDEVTEAMNLLAWALVELTRPAPPMPTLVAKAPVVLPLAPEPPTVVPDDDLPPALPVVAPVLELLPESKFVTDAEPEIRRPFQDLRPDTIAPNRRVEKTPPRYELRDADSVRPQSKIEAPSRPVSLRRAAVRNIVKYRRLLASWDTVGAYLTQHGVADSTRADAIGVVLAFREIESSAWALPERDVGGIVLRLAQIRPNITTLWELTVADRENLREDWRAGRLRLQNEYQRLRRGFKRPRDRNLRIWLDRARQFAPHATVIAASIAAFVIGIVRLTNQR